MQIDVRLLKPLKNRVVRYTGTLLVRTEHYLLIRACWSGPTADLGFVQFATGDIIYEHFYADKWYNIFELRTPVGTLKGWYCNIARPARFVEDAVESEDLELDLFVPPNHNNILLLDEDEFAARNLATSEPAAYSAALNALDDLRHMVACRAPPFDAAHTQHSGAR